MKDWSTRPCYCNECEPGESCGSCYFNGRSIKEAKIYIATLKSGTRVIKHLEGRPHIKEPFMGKDVYLTYDEKFMFKQDSIREANRSDK